MWYCRFHDFIPKKKEIALAVFGNIQSIYDCNNKMAWQAFMEKIL